MVHLRLLGSTEVVDDNGQPLASAMRRQKVLAVLAYLAAARPRGMHRRDKVAALFWPELSDDRARAALRVALTRLRAEVGAEVLVTRGADEIAIDPARLACDVAELDDALAGGDAERASRLYRGPFMDGVHVEGASEELEEWMSVERQRLRDATVRTLSGVADSATTSPPAALRLLRRAAEIAPADESVHERLIELLIAAGDRAGALAVYHELEGNLARSLEIAPSRRISARVASLRSVEPAPVNRAPPVPSTNGASSDAGAPVAPLARPDPLIAHAMRRATGGATPWLIAGSLITLLALTGALARDRRSPSATPLPAAKWALLAAPSSGIRPVGRIEAGAALDSTGALVLFGGQLYAPDSSRALNDLWRLHGLEAGRESEWTRLSPRSGRTPRARWLFGMASDQDHDRILVHGGAFGRTSPCAADTWVLDHASDARVAWRPVAIRGAAIPPRAGFNAAYDAASRRLLVFGGHDCVSTFFNETWVLAFDDSTLASGHWLRLDADTAVGAPARRSSYASAYDATRHRFYVLGGSASGNPSAGLWVLEHADGATGRARWRSARCDGAGPTRNGGSAAFDAATNSLLFFGGMDSTVTHRRDLWRATGLGDALEHCRWQLLPQSEPYASARSHATLLIDRNAVVLFGGAFNDNGLSDAWVLRGWGDAKRD